MGLYDNGDYLLGTKKDIVNQTYNYMLEEENDEYYMQLLEELNDYEDTDILVLYYSNGMGFNIVRFSQNDKLEV